MNIATIAAVILVAAAVLLAIRSIYKGKKKGSACSGCPYAGSCCESEKCGPSESGKAKN